MGVTIRRGQRLIIGLTLMSLSLLTGCGRSFPARDLADAGGLHCSSDRQWRPGCATSRNIAAMAENADDLILARRETPRDAMRRDAVIGSYMRSRASASSPSAASPAKLMSEKGGAK